MPGETAIDNAGERCAKGKCKILVRGKGVDPEPRGGSGFCKVKGHLLPLE